MENNDTYRWAAQSQNQDWGRVPGPPLLFSFKESRVYGKGGVPPELGSTVQGAESEQPEGIQKSRVLQITTEHAVDFLRNVSR